MANTHTEVRDWRDQYRTIPEPGMLLGGTLITCTHAYHGMDRFYLSVDDFQDKLIHIVGAYWVNGYTIVMQPTD